MNLHLRNLMLENFRRDIVVCSIVSEQEELVKYEKVVPHAVAVTRKFRKPVVESLKILHLLCIYVIYACQLYIHI
jgi:hypothetical protein